MTQSYYQPIAYNLEKGRFVVLEKITACFSGYELYLKAIVTTPTTAKSQHLLFNRDYAHSVIYTLTSIESYLNFILKTIN
jgi:hypothetical protein